MGFVQNGDGEWVKKGVVTPQKGGDSRSDSEEGDDEDEEEADTERTLWVNKLLFLFLHGRLGHLPYFLLLVLS